MLGRAVAEAAGTFFLVLVGAASVVVDARTGGALGAAGVALAFGGVVAAMVWLFAPVSGAHINPAVTLAFWSAGRFPAREVLPYVAAQCGGAAAAAFLVVAALGAAGRAGATVPAVPPAAALLAEWLLSFILMFSICSVALGGAPRAPPRRSSSGQPSGSTPISEGRSQGPR